MARPAKIRKICRLPAFLEFEPKEQEHGPLCRLELNVEEYEVIRLLDYEGYSQETCAKQMEISRSTVQALYNEARKKMARFLVEGCSLQISGGHYAVCSYSCPNQSTGKSHCLKGNWKKEGGNIMTIAVTYEDGQVFQHFGHTEQFKIYEVEEGKVVSSQVVDTNGSGHGALAGFLAEYHVDVLICGGIGGGARNALAEAGIKLYPGAMGDADGQVASFLTGSLQYNPDTVCAHHGEGHSHSENHNCGEHHCGSHESCH